MEMGLLMREKGAKKTLTANSLCIVLMKECILFVEKHSPPIELIGSFGSFVNISLRSKDEGLSAFPPLFTSKQIENGESKSAIISLTKSSFSSFCLSAAPFLSSPSIHLASLSHLTFFNISTAPSDCPSPTITSNQTTYFMSSCSFSSVCDAYDGGIVHSLNDPLASLIASNTSFVGCCRTRNVVCEGNADGKLTPGRRNETDNGANSFTWCEWNGSKTTGKSDSYEDGVSSGGAIYMHNLGNGELSVSHCLFNNCFAFSRGGGIMCRSIKSIKIENNSFSSCNAQNQYGGGLYAYSISSCVRISLCNFENCKAISWGGGLYLELFQFSGTDRIGNEKGEGESVCVFDCRFTLCSISTNHGGGLFCRYAPEQFKMRSIQFFSCSAFSCGGALWMYPDKSIAPSDGIYCYFLFFHECICRTTSTPYGHDVMFYVHYDLFHSSGNPFFECFTTNANEHRVCYGYNYTDNNWSYKQTEKKDWLIEKTVFVSVNGNDSNEQCGANESCPCLTVKKALEMCEVQICLTITLMDGNHTSETTTIEIGIKKISVIGKGREASSIGTGTLSSVGTLFSVTTGYLGFLHMKVDCNSSANPSPSVVVVSDGGGSLSLEDVVITTSISSGNYVISSSVFVVPLSQLLMTDVEIINMNVSKSLFSEPDLSSSSSSSSALFLSSTVSGESMIVNLSVKNVKLTEGDGVAVAKSVAEGETFVVQNVTIEDCKCEDGSGGGINVELETDTSKLQVEATTTIKRCTSWKYGGGMMLYLADNSIDFSIVSVDFSGCSASLGGNYVFVNGSNSVNWGITREKLNVQHDDSNYNELVGYDRSDTTMGLFPLNVYLDSYPDAAHVGKGKDGLGGYDSWFCGFDYYPCATITHAAQVRYADTNKKIELDSGFELCEAVGMTDGNEWEISCARKGVEVGVKAPENFESSLKVEGLVITETLRFGEHSLVEFGEGVESVVVCGCEVNNIEKRRGDGGWVSGVVGAEGDEEKNGMIVIESCVVKGCRCVCGRGGGMSVVVKGEGSVVVNGGCVIDGCEAKGSRESSGGSEGRGGGMMIVMESRDGSLKIESGTQDLFGGNIEAENGKDVFVDCGRGVLLESKVNGSSFEFFESSVIPSDILKLCGSEDGREEEVIPLFVYLCSIGSKLRVDGKGERALDHDYCGFEEFGCVTIDYCVNKRASSTVNEIEVVSESWINSEMKVVSFEVCVSGKEEGMRVSVRDEGSFSQNNLIECSKSFEIGKLAFVLNEQMNGRRRAFIHSSSSSTITMTSCSISFGDDELIGFNVICIEGGRLIANGFVMELGVRMNEKSPIEITNGVELEMNDSRMSGMEVTGGIGGGCLNVEMKEGGGVNIEGCNLSSVCSGGSGMKGGGMKISVGKGGSLEMKKVNLSGCEVPTEDREDGGRGVGGGTFVKLSEQMGSFVLEGMIFEGCYAWKGKNVFVSGWDLSEIVNKEHFKWEMSSEELGSLDELCGWERKTTGEEGYVIPLVVYLWRNWSGDGFVSKEKGGDFSGCGYSEAPCSSIDHLISLRYPTLGEGETHIAIVVSGLLSHSILFSSSISDSSKVVIEGTKKGTAVTISDEDENDLDGCSMISSNVSLSIVNVSFTKLTMTTQHEVFIESSGANTLLSVSDCSFGSLAGLTETAGYCVMRVNGGDVVIERCSLSLISELKGLIAFSPSAAEVTLQNVNISFASVKERSLISMIEEGNLMSGDKSTHSNGNKPILRVVGCSFANITNEGNGASGIEVGSFEHGVECVIDECSMSSCKSSLSDEGGGVKVVLKSEESVLKVNGSSFSTCKCSSETGRGGGLFIDGSDPNANYDDETQIPPLNFKIVNMLFVMNDAFSGKDIFVRCLSIAHQINETLFILNYNQESLNSNNSICGRNIESEEDVDLIPLITFYYLAQVFVSRRGTDGRGCGAQSNSCSSINCGVGHIQEGVMNAILIDGEGTVRKECVIGDLVVSSFKKTQAIVKLNSKIEKSGEKDCIMEFVNECSVERCSFQFEDSFEATHSCIMKVTNGSMEIQKCEFFFSATAVDMKLNSSVVSIEKGELKISETTFRDLNSILSVLSFHEESNVMLLETSILNIKCEEDVASVGGKAKVEMKIMMIENVTLLSERCVVSMEDAEQEESVLNCSFGKCVNSVDKGSMMQIRRSKEVKVEACVFDGEKEDEIINEEVERKNEELCKWNGSLVDVENSKVEMKETMIMQSKAGGLWASGGSVKIENGKFENNNPLIEGYPSARRNVICEGNGELNVVSVKGGDGWKDNSSLWILDEGCELGGIAGERGSSYFIPVLEEVKNINLPNGNAELMIHGKLLLPCDLSVKMSMKNGGEEEIVRKGVEEEGFVSENEISTIISCSELEKVREETEVSVCIVFGKADSPSSTESFIIKNKSEPKVNGDERIVEGGKKGKSIWTIIVVVLTVLFLIVLIGFILFVVRWKKQKRRTRELEEIVNETVKKDPKAFEMVTMEMSPEEQWRRAEKKNEERIKKRVYEKSFGHSESSEHLLSESGSTEYILGRDSDKIPQWILEKDEEEEIRKRTPSPSISSTSTTDSDSTFVRGEDLCPTTSSMSNLVDAMACSSPHEKLIVDLRDSLFMLLHGKNEKKEMAIGTLQEREQTAAQILFWVANGALHSFDEMENKLQSLSNLSPHIVLFSEHMVICIVMHSDLLSDGSDSSSISSSTVVTSTSDDDDRDSLPSSAFEDEEDNRKECMRWKAPELLNGTTKHATKKTVVFSIGMMLWECVTLKIPFGEYEAVVAGQKILNGERPNCSKASSSYDEVVLEALSEDKKARPTLIGMKRELFENFPAGAVIFTVSDAITYDGDSNVNVSELRRLASCSGSNQ
ncbi:uncharacterized protein MONOS_7619 [Monocercomonoides exilis]|uniref:uncharacterized protein n=1 Tax=Monocercomonoides exilis TaxID=2049356 RepID=UPI0035595A70|nr:hypothetical protein MONOS_7619 [Monocercomonoides exilis]|eukprot:MONOS_7619.1-p1 / transcript=MONOS_7619.1 / gene=MONOS_7619 / organism=Monocercomonoides_exilis_PA203 / gene_product=unspecified product / transcript_product=unspecified product / location=Mono_scaffold00265:28805-37522(-) / protein_length=2842 / sequence_SO=supercontig / SO=protein_coding / is_pseudo=false